MQRPALLPTLAGSGAVNGRCHFRRQAMAEDVALRSDIRGQHG